MKIRTLFICLILATAALFTASAGDDKDLDGPWVNPPTEKIPNTQHATFMSKSLGRPVGYNIYLPPQRKDKQKLPVVYHLHGRTDSESTHLYNLRLLDRAIDDGKVPPMICVYAYAGRQSWFTDWKNGPVKSATIVRELIAHVDATYPTDAKRESRGFLGWSMGGFGALKFGLQAPEQTSAVVCFGGAFLNLDNVKKRPAKDFDRIFGNDDDYFRSNSPVDLVPKRAEAVQGKVAIRLAVGAKDTLLETNRSMHKLLDTHKFAHEYEEVPDVGHNPKAMYEAQLVQAFAFFAKAFGGEGK